MSQPPSDTIVILIALMMVVSTLIYNYTLLAEHLDDENGWEVWSRSRWQIAGRRGRAGKR
ncbi:MAG: hypothetical protein ACK2T3_14840 [Candidatus Promineifilaceae bacterium]|jgi:hypothetical protein